MADEQKKKITDLPSASSVGDNDLFTIVQGGVATKIATTEKVGERINTAQAFSTLTTTSKNIVGAINELKESGGASSFADLTDVDIDDATLTNGQVPKYNSSTHKWENGTVSGGGGAASDISYDNTTSGLTADDVQDAIDELAQGGSGGGHTILDDSGTSLTQRADLQFKGAYSEDNSTDQITEVNVVRSMTREQFDLLSADEKVGFINITDETGGGDYHEYSTSEKVVGKWIDDSMVYEKTFHIQPSGNVSDYADVDTISTDKVISIKLVAKRQDASNTWYYQGEGAISQELPNYNNYKIGARVYDGKLQYFLLGYGTEIKDVWFTVRYTKVST